MKRGPFLVLAASVGLNAGLLFTTFYHRGPAPQPPPPPAFLEDGPPPPEGRAGGPDPNVIIRDRLLQMSTDLRLDDRQRRAMRRILEQTLPRILAQREAAHEARRAVRRAYDQEVLVPERVRALVARQSLEQARVDSLVAETILLEAEILAPEQRIRYLRLMPWNRNPDRPDRRPRRDRPPQDPGARRGP